ncbi:hypothetical protein Gbfr_006_072 [Gluconobacter frateurii M-2]|nr:hypothetical protein Gbfr_006_072 [Gluconobacter frateurii M-2]
MRVFRFGTGNNQLDTMALRLPNQHIGYVLTTCDESHVREVRELDTKHKIGISHPQGVDRLSVSVRGKKVTT